MASAADSGAGESIYLKGILGSGAALHGERAEQGLGLDGAAAACAHCHQRSGLGSSEAALKIPPISGAYLFHSDAQGVAQSALPYVQGAHTNRDPYTDVTLARAIRQGLDGQGRPLSVLMPRYSLDDADMAALIAYLKQLEPQTVPGVTDILLHFATVITPDADPVKRQGVLDVLQNYFDEKNRFPFAPTPPMRTSGKTLYSKSMYMANRRWQLHVWQLHGPASTWTAQLDAYQAQEPVLAVISGVGGRDWSPVHRFCEQQRVPCLFPNVEVPTVADGDFYSLYFSRGVLLEAQLIARAVREGNGSLPKVVRQVYRPGDSGEDAAKALAQALSDSGIRVQNIALHGAAGQGVADAVRHGAGDTALVLWLRPADIAALGAAPGESDRVFMSGIMGGLEDSPLPAAWRSRTELSYPFDLPDRRVIRVDYALGWFRYRRIPVVAEQVQADTFLACGILAETVTHLSDNIVPEYLVETTWETLEHRYLTGYYPRLSLGTGQTMSSKGGYLVKFSEPAGSKVIPDGDWRVP